MAIKRQFNWLSQARIDVPHWRSVESAISADFDDTLRGMITGIDAPYVIKGFKLIHAIGSLATSLQVEVEDSAILHSSASESGTIMYVPSGTLPETLDITNDKVSGSFIAGTTNYVALDYTREPDEDTNDIMSFFSKDTNREFTKTVPLARILHYQFVVSSIGFGDGLPLAKVVTDASGYVTQITDCRPMLLRLGAGGDVPDPDNEYAWPDGPNVPGSGRAENPSTSTIAGLVNTPFEGGDKEIYNLKAWCDAVMSRIKEMDGQQYWYSPSVGSVTSLAQNQNIHILDSGVLWSWNVVTETLTWDDTVTFQIPGTANLNTMAANSVILGAGQVAYVTIDRDNMAAVLVAVVVDADDLPIHQDVFVFARRDGDDIIIGTHSFRLKHAEVSESDYSDHLAKENLFKTIADPAGASDSVFMWPSQRMSGGKRRYVYISPTASSKFPRTGYTIGEYDGGANDNQLTEINVIDNIGTLEISAVLPTYGYELLHSEAIAAWGPNLFTPVLISITTTDTFVLEIGNHYATLAEAKEDDNLPVPALGGSYPVAVIIVETDGATAIQPFTEDHIVDRRPTGAGGSGGGSGGTYTEYIATGGETVIVLPLGQTYVPGLNDLMVVENGVELYEGAGRDYLEINPTTIQLLSPAVAGDRFKFRTGNISGTGVGTLYIVGPGAATDEALVRYDGVTGKVAQNSLVLLNDFGDFDGIRHLTMTGTLTGGSSPFDIVSVETDGGAAIGFRLTADNALTTDGSRILNIVNDTLDSLVMRYGTSTNADPNMGLFELYDIAGVLGLEIATSAAFTDISAVDLAELRLWAHNVGTPDYAKIVLDPDAEIGLYAFDGVTKEGHVIINKSVFTALQEDTGLSTETSLLTDNTCGTIAFGHADLGFALNIMNLGCLALDSSGVLIGGNAGAGSTAWSFSSLTVDGAGAIGYQFDTDNTISNAAAKLVSWLNNGTEVLFLGTNGLLVSTPGTFESLVPDGGAAVGFTLTTPAYINPAAKLLSLYNGLSEKLYVDLDGKINGVDIATAITEDFFTNKGDLIVATAASTPAILPIGATPDGYVLQTDSSAPEGVRWGTAGAGDVFGPASATNTALARWDGITGKLLMDSLTTLDNVGAMTMGGAVTFKRTFVSTDYTSDNETLIGVDTALSVTITLSELNKLAGRFIDIKDETGQANANPITIQTEVAGFVAATVDGTAGGIITIDDASDFEVNCRATVIDNDTTDVTGYIVAITPIGAGLGVYDKIAITNGLINGRINVADDVDITVNDYLEIDDDNSDPIRGYVASSTRNITATYDRPVYLTGQVGYIIVDDATLITVGDYLEIDDDDSSATRGFVTGIVSVGAGTGLYTQNALDDCSATGHIIVADTTDMNLGDCVKVEDGDTAAIHGFIVDIDQIGAGTGTYDELATVNGTALGVITIGTDPSTIGMTVGDYAEVNDDGTAGASIRGYIVGTTDIGGGNYEIHLQDAPVAGADIDLSPYLVANAAEIYSIDAYDLHIQDWPVGGNNVNLSAYTLAQTAHIDSINADELHIETYMVGGTNVDLTDFSEDQNAHVYSIDFTLNIQDVPGGGGVDIDLTAYTTAENAHVYSIEANELHIQDAPGGGGLDIDLSNYTVTEDAKIYFHPNIDADGTTEINTSYGVLRLYSNGTKWFIR